MGSTCCAAAEVEPVRAHLGIHRPTFYVTKPWLVVGCLLHVFFFLVPWFSLAGMVTLGMGHLVNFPAAVLQYTVRFVLFVTMWCSLLPNTFMLWNNIPVMEHWHWHLCKVFGDFGDAGTSVHLGTLWHQQDVGGATYFPATTSSVDLLICNQ